MWNILNRNRCETMADIFRDSIKFDKEWLDMTIKTLSSDYKDSLESGDLICLSRGSLYYISWIEENNTIYEKNIAIKKEPIILMVWSGLDIYFKVGMKILILQVKN